MIQQWTTSDFHALSWHDCSIHGFHLGALNEASGSAELVIDIDFILEWLPQGDRTFRFRLAPATLTFHDVFGLRFAVDYVTPAAGMTPFSIAGIERTPFHVVEGHTSYHWRLPISWPDGEITFDSPGFTQVLRSEPIIQPGQCLTAGERGGFPVSGH